MLKKALLAIPVCAALLFGPAASAQTLIGTCDGTVGVVTHPTGLGNVYCTPVGPPLPPPPLLPTATITANPTSITTGQSSTLMWQSTNATACSASGNWNGTEPISGSLVVSPPATETYTLTCTGNGGSASASASVTVTPVVIVGGNCGMQLGSIPAFCDTFDVAAGIGNRSGQLNGTIWGVSRWTGDMNLDAAHQSPWVQSTMTGCNGPQPAQADSTDIIICGGHLRESTNDNATGAFEAGGVIALAMYPKQPFDFAGRTGTISFDVSNDTEGSHGVWPELWITDTPKPAPFLHFDDTGGASIPANAFALRFSGSVPAGQGAQLGPNCPNDDNIRWTVGSAAAVRNYVIDDTEGFGVRSNMAVTTTGCVIAPIGANGGLNHVEVRISQNQVDVYATDAGTITPLVHIASITNANLSFTRGLVWIEDVHYNADKSLRLPLQHDHTFVWDNFAFDGPVLARDLSYDVLDSLTACHDGTVCLGFDSPSASQPASFNTLPMTTTAIAAANAQFLMFDAWFEVQPTTISFTLNGHPYSFPWSFPYSSGQAIQSFMFAVNKSDLVAGPNAIVLWADQYVVVSNVNVVLAGAGGTVGPVTSLCQFMSGTATAAFCESVASASPGGRAGDLDDSKWSVSRGVGGLSATNLIVFPPVQVSACKSGVTSVVPDNDIMVCDAASGHLGQFETAMIAQNYAMISMRPRQKFDFTGRTGIITFNVDAITQGEGSWWPAVYVTDEPVSGAINSASVMGLLPVNGIGLNFNDECGVTDASMTSIGNVFVYANTVESSVNMVNPACFSTKRGQLNHIEIKLSTTRVEIWASDFSPDNVTFPNLRMVASAAISIPFSSGYVHFEQKERAPIKNELGFYTPGYANNYWSNLGFDGPLTATEVGYEVPDALTSDPNSATDSDSHIAGGLNIGYGLLNAPYSMYSCCSLGLGTMIGAFSIPGVNLTGVSSAKLTFSVAYTYVAPNFTPSNVALRYSLNGGPLLSPNPQPNYVAQQACTACPGPAGAGGVTYSFPVNISNLVSGTNTIAFAVDNTWNSFPPVIANIELLTFH